MVCRDAVKKAKALLELDLAKEAKDNKKVFEGTSSEKRTTRKCVDPLLKEVDALVTGNAEKAEILNPPLLHPLTLRLAFRNPSPGGKRDNLSKGRLFTGWGGASQRVSKQNECTQIHGP